MAIYYHGTTTIGLSTLIPREISGTTLHKPTVYFTDEPALAALYIWNKPFKYMTYQFSPDEITVYEEWFPNQLEYFYEGVSGVIYYSESPLIKPTHMQKVFTADENVEVIPYKTVADAYETICEYEKSGHLIIRRYESLTTDELLYIENQILTDIRRNKLLSHNDEKVIFVRETFLDIWEKAEKEAR